MLDPALLAHLASGGTVITATRRLSRELTHQFDQHHIDHGDRSWESADILPLEAWLIRSWDALQPSIEQPKMLLSDGQELALWRDIIEQDVARNDRESAALWNHFATAREAARAWRMIHEWRLDEAQISASRHGDHRAFMRWSRAFTARCEQHDWLDGAQLGAHISTHLAALQPGSICLVGFDSLSPDQQALVDALETYYAATEAGLTQIGSVERDHTASPVSRWPDEFSQWLAAGEWARHQLTEASSRRVAIVVPNLGQSRSVVEYAMRQTLCQGDLLSPNDVTTLPFHLSLGRPLLEYDAGREALTLIEVLTADHLLPDQVANLLRSPWIAGYAEEIDARSLLFHKLQRSLPWRTSLGELRHKVAELATCPRLGDMLSEICTLRGEGEATATFSYWSKWIGELLGLIGWPGAPARRSDLYQTTEAILSQIKLLAEIDLVSAATDLAGAVQVLGHRLGSQVFQPEAHDAPVQILGVLESAGLEFDAVWFGNLIEDSWPGGTRPNPFLPVRLQQEAGVPTASHDSVHALALGQMRRLAAATPNLRLSTYIRDGDVSISPSPLIRDCPAENALKIPLTLAETMQSAGTPVSRIDDSAGPDLGDTTKLKGGTSLIRAQSYCPRGAFLRYRFGAETSRPLQQGLDPAERGTLIHWLLDQLWLDIGCSAELARITDADLESRIASKVANGCGRYMRSSGCGSRFFEIQRQWLIHTLMAWFAVERRRKAAFEVLAREEDATLDLAGLPLQFKIDRIDRFEDGSLGLVDYKTGGSQSVGEWGEQRPNEPQLPLYWLSQQADARTTDCRVVVVAFAYVRLGDCRLVGVTSLDTMEAQEPDINLSLPETHRTLRKLFDNWDAMTTHWTQSMTALGDEFRSGVASVDPRNHGLCRGCPTPAFCRSGDDLDDATDEAGFAAEDAAIVRE